MTEFKKTVIGPAGTPLALDDLPHPTETRWTTHRKAEVVAAVDGDLLTFESALALYSLTAAELAGWQRAVDRSGLAGLRITRSQHYRDLYARRDGY